MQQSDQDADSIQLQAGSSWVLTQKKGMVGFVECNLSFQEVDFCLRWLWYVPERLVFHWLPLDPWAIDLWLTPVLQEKIPSPGHNIAPRTIPEGALAPETSLLGHYSSGGKRFLLEISADPFCSPNYPPIRQPNGMWKNANLIGPRDTLEYALTTWRVSVALVAADL